MGRAANPTPKNLITCCDGTGNEIAENISNVPKLHPWLRRTDKTQPRQMVPCASAAGTATPTVNTPLAR